MHIVALVLSLFVGHARAFEVQAPIQKESICINKKKIVSTGLHQMYGVEKVESFLQLIVKCRLPRKEVKQLMLQLGATETHRKIQAKPLVDEFVYRYDLNELRRMGYFRKCTKSWLSCLIDDLYDQPIHDFEFEYDNKERLIAARKSMPSF